MSEGSKRGERERERERDAHTHTRAHTHINILKLFSRKISLVFLIFGFREIDVIPTFKRFYICIYIYIAKFLSRHPQISLAAFRLKNDVLND